MMTERCPGCGGPVERRAQFPLAHDAAIGPCECGATHQEGDVLYVALPDSLAGIEEERASEYDRIEHETASPDADAFASASIYGVVLARLFNGCAACGRKGLNQHVTISECMEARDKDKRQAFQQAAEVAESRVGDVESDSHLSDSARDAARTYCSAIAADLRKLAEDA